MNRLPGSAGNPVVDLGQSEPAVLIIGFGTSLMGDDGVGHAVVERLNATDLPPGVRAVAAGSDSLTLPSLCQGEARVWMVDAMVRWVAPGTVHRLDHDEVLSIPQRHATVHHLSLPESLRWIALSYPEMAGIRYRLWGVEPQSLDLGETLSPPVAAAVDVLAREIGRRLRIGRSRAASPTRTAR